MATLKNKLKQLKEKYLNNLETNKNFKEEIKFKPSKVVEQRPPIKPKSNSFLNNFDPQKSFVSSVSSKFDHDQLFNKNMNIESLDLKAKLLIEKRFGFIY